MNYLLEDKKDFWVLRGILAKVSRLGYKEDKERENQIKLEQKKEKNIKDMEENCCLTTLREDIESVNQKLRNPPMEG